MLMEARLLDERREGEAVGIAKGKEIGIAEGKEIGLAEEKLATAKRMLAKGCYSLEVIAELTNLSLADVEKLKDCLLYTSPSPRDRQKSRMPSSA